MNRDERKVEIYKRLPREIDLDRSLVHRRGLSEFVKLAWPLVEPAKLEWNWHIPVICRHLEAVSKGEIQNLLICIPPGCMKTLLVSVFWPSWEWACVDASTKWIYSTYGQELSNRSALQHRNLFSSDWYQDRWGWRSGALSREKKRTVKFFENTKFGFRFSTSVGGEATGRHGNRIVFDDLVKAQGVQGERNIFDPKQVEVANEFWEKTMSSRAADPETVSKVGIMQRMHHDDPAARCIKSGNYEVLTFPMSKKAISCSTKIDPSPDKREGNFLWPARFPEHVVAPIKKALGPRLAEAQYEQNPTPPGGNIFKSKWFKFWGDPNVDRHRRVNFNDMQLLSSWDLNLKGGDGNDFVVGAMWGRIGGDYLLLDLTRERWAFLESTIEFKKFIAKWPRCTSHLVENKANGPALKSSLQSLISGIELIEPQGDKESRAIACEPVFAAGNVYFPYGTTQWDTSRFVEDGYGGDVPWMKDFCYEHLAFPFAENDDQVDTTSQVLIHMHFSEAANYLADLGRLVG